MRLTVTVEVEVERVSGLFAPKSDIEDEVVQAIESADPGSISGVGSNGDSEYEVVAWEVTVA